MRVLVAEDNRHVLKMIEDILMDAGHIPVLASNGQEAWELLDRGEEFNLIISDYNMPEMTGVELLQRVRENARTIDIPFVLISGRVTISDADPTLLENVCINLDATFLPKPFPLPALLSMLGVGVELCD